MLYWRLKLSNSAKNMCCRSAVRLRNLLITQSNHSVQLFERSPIVGYYCLVNAIIGIFCKACLISTHAPSSSEALTQPPSSRTCMQTRSSMGNTFSEIFPPKPHWTADNIHDLSDKVALITGGYSGIGYATSKVDHYRG